MFRYGCISSRLTLSEETPSENCVNILSIVSEGAFPHSYQLGQTKVFLRENLYQLLEEARLAKLNRVAITIQAKVM